MSMPSHMMHSFSQIPNPQRPRSTFRDRVKRTSTIDGGWVYPMACWDILPGDVLKVNARFFARLNTLINPIMDTLHFDVFWFFGQKRRLWGKYVNFFGEKLNISDTTEYEMPYLVATEGEYVQFDELTLGDYLGLPTRTPIATDDHICSLPFRMYYDIYNNWFRDQRLQNPLTLPVGDGPDLFTGFSLWRRNKRPDVFTSCLPYPQDQANASYVVSGVPVHGSGPLGFSDATNDVYTMGDDNSNIIGVTSTRGALGSDQVAFVFPDLATGHGTQVGVNPDALKSGLVGDLTITINELREAIALQLILEQDARGGTRFPEILQVVFGTRIPEAAIRPEYLGGSSDAVHISQVAQTSATDVSTTPQATLAAFGQLGSQNGFVKSFDEPGYVMCLVNIRSEITYQGGLERMWSTRTRFDEYRPELAHLGEDAVPVKEIFYDTTEDNPNRVFGYQERWYQYRRKISMVTGKMRSNATGSLDSWHLATEFAEAPVLNAAFIEDSDVQVNIDRVIAVPSEPQFNLDCFFEVEHTRLLPTYSNPSRLGM